AHQKGVIHRDLKPSNVLVTLEGGKPIPKVIDFGIAKAIEEPLTEKTILTNFHSFIGTPAYTSPEQAEMTGSVVDTRSDIYSLGVLLYELLTGVTPFDAKELISSGLEDRKSTRLNSSHVSISYAVFCLKKKKKSILINNTGITTALTTALCMVAMVSCLGYLRRPVRSIVVYRLPCGMSEDRLINLRSW